MIDIRERTKEIILKTLLVFGVGLLFVIFPGSILVAFLVPDQTTFDNILYTILFTLLGDGILFIILLPIFGGLKQKPLKAEKTPLLFSSYNDFLSFIQKELSEKGYQVQKTLPIPSNGEVTVYVKPPKQRVLGCFTIVRVPELSEETLPNVNQNITKVLIEYYRGKIITDAINMITVFCVDRISPTFHKLVNSNIQQGLKNGRLPVGISFGGKSIYIAKQVDGFAARKYKRLRKEFFEILGLSD